MERLLSGGGLVRLPLANRAAATLRLQAARTPAALLEGFRREWAQFAGPAEAAMRRVLHVWTGALLADMGGVDPALPALAELEGLEGGTEMATVSQALLGKWYQDVRAEHVAEGIEQERSRSLARLRRQAAIKFGAQTAERLSALLGAALAPNQLERLEDRASDWIMECERGEDLLARISAFVGNGGSGR